MNYLKKLCWNRKLEWKRKKEQLRKRPIKLLKKGRKSRIMGIYFKFKATIINNSNSKVQYLF